MLIQFSFKNIGSFKEEAKLDMSAVKAYKEHSYNLITGDNNEKYLKVASIYGANASGKSNFIEAFIIFRNIVLNSFNNKNENDKTVLANNYAPYLFQDKDNNNSEFEVVLIDGGYEYQYGFIYNKVEVVYEWLYRKNIETSRKIIVFEREKSDIQFGPSVRKESQIYSEQIEKDVLVLSFFNRLKMKTLIYSTVFKNIFTILAVDTEINDHLLFLLKRNISELVDKQKRKLLEFLNAIDSGIKDISYEKEKDIVNIFTYHFDKANNEYKVPIEIESEGTIKSMLLFMFVSNAINNNKALLIDELNIKLHPLILKFIVDMFHSSNTKGQLVYTTHDTTLLDRRYFRRDQVWFVNKDQEGCSNLYSLSDFKVRTDDASLERDYLGGVYGGIPILKDFTMEEVNSDGE